MLDAPHGDVVSTRMSEWSEEVAALAAMVDRLGVLIRALVSLNGGKPPDLDPYPRPVTAVDRLRERRGRERHLRLLGELLPHDDAG